MITQKFAEKQVRRLGGLDDFPKFAPDAEAELVIMARKYGRSDAHVLAAFDEIISGWTKCPKPSELRHLLDRDRGEFSDVNCIFCAGSGWKIVEKEGISGAARCSCGSIPVRTGTTPPEAPRKRSGGAGASGTTKAGETVQ